MSPDLPADLLPQLAEASLDAEPVDAEPPSVQLVRYKVAEPLCVVVDRHVVAERDFFKNPVAYANLDLLKSNLQINASRKTKEAKRLHLARR